MSSLIKVRQSCSGLSTYPLMTMGATILLLDILVPMILYGLTVSPDSKIRKNSKNSKKGEKEEEGDEEVFIPSVSATWRNSASYPLSAVSFSVILVVYNICLYEAWLIATVDAFLLLVVLTYAINPTPPAQGEFEEKKKMPPLQMVHLSLAATICLVIASVTPLIVIYWYGTDPFPTVGVVFAILVYLSLIILSCFTGLSLMGTKLSLKWRRRAWVAWDVCEILFFSFFCCLIALIPEAMSVN